IHMPLIVAGPGVAPGQVRNDLVSGIDVTATTLAAAGQSVPAAMEGRNFLAADYQPREFLVSARDRCDYTIEKIRAVVTPRFKYLRNYLTDRPYMQPSYKDEWPVSQRLREMMAAGEMNATQLIFFGDSKPPEELYDLDNDPHEIHNLAGDPEYADELHEQRRLLADWIAQTGDQGQQPESEVGLRCVLKRWGDLCVNPEYEPVRAKMEAEAAARKPNIIFVLCDDLGWGDLGVFHQNNSSHNKKFATPELDTMATGGVQLRQHYCPAPVCAPSRASLLMGVHQGHCAVRDNQFDKQLPDNHTLATVLRSAGYATALVGKYGLQGDRRYALEKNGTNPQTWPAYPTKRGFDQFFGYVRHVDGHVHYPAHEWPLGDSPAHRSPKELWHNQEEISKQLKKCYTTDLFTAYAKQWITEQATAKPNEPFFLYLAYDTPHAALQVPSVAYPPGKGLRGGVQWLGREDRMINTARGKIDSYRYPEFTNQGWSDVEERFATMVRRIDDCMGDLLQTLRDLDIAENTLVVLSSDNGPHHEAYLQASYNPTSFQSYGPFDGTKRDCWEGGIRVPTLAYWPDTIPANTIDPSPSQFHDWMATFAEVAGIHPPARCDGVSLLPTMTGRGERAASQVYVEYQQQGRTKPYEDFEPRKRQQQRGQMQVVFLDGYKGIRLDIQDPHQAFEIYDVRADQSELNNLAAASPAMRVLQERMQQQVLRLRRPDPSAPRPYDAIPIPSVPLDDTEPGMQLATVSGSFAFVPKLSSLNSNVAPRIVEMGQPVELAAGAAEWTGYVQIPSDGEYTFHFRSPNRAVVRIHDALLFDNDFQHQPDREQTTRLPLAAGYHPIRITMVTTGASSAWNLEAYNVNDLEHELIGGNWVTTGSDK
ncbi:MAG: sulfatase-like hydrolase/transferase, partial [Planctomycetales bacterium]|nr:sulfatase-like hydrolase/transferase [Planctomycetales bacterium]